MKLKFLSVAFTAALAVSSCCNNPKTALFNGRDLVGWHYIADGRAEETFTVRDGNLRISGEPFGYVRTVQQYADYELHVEWRWVGEPTNSGIFLHVQPGDKVWPNAIECQLMAGRAGDFVMLGGSKIAEVESDRPFPIKPRLGDACEKTAGEWNTADILCKGDRITVRINGELQNECSGTNGRGYIALQSEGGPLEFRNVYIVEIK